MTRTSLSSLLSPARLRAPHSIAVWFRITAPWLGSVLLIGAWEAASRLGLLAERLMPSPSDVVAAGVQQLLHGGLAGHLAVSTLRATAGVLIGASLGLTLGLMTGLSRALQLLLDGPLQMLRAVPALALVPLVILWFGLGESGKVFIVAITVVFPVYLNTFHGVRSVDPQLVEMARVYGLGRAQLYQQVIFPGALPSILVGLRFALGLAWLVMIVAESLGATSGLGYLAQNAREFMQMDLLVLTIVLWAALGKLADLLMRNVERRVLPWLPKAQRLGVN